MVELPLSNGDIYSINPSKIIALGLNYKEHIAESQSVKVQGFTNEIPNEPILFPKTPNVLIGPDEPIIIPKFLSEYNFQNLRIDHEAELAFIIKEKCKNVSSSKAFDYILGFVAFNDVSQRNLQRSDKSGWWRGKSLDTFGPIGPKIILTKDLNDPQNLDIECRVNGKIKQKGNTNQMIFQIPEILSFISKNFKLEAGDIVSTGTPSGVSPIKDGDIVEIEIEQIGTLKNPVIEEK